MMYYSDRLREEDCGCRYDVVTGLTTHYCPRHDPTARCAACGRAVTVETAAAGFGLLCRNCAPAY